nr:putative ribonuclease H-like domain-containing protein [Tanacetum cinerariifolium]
MSAKDKSRLRSSDVEDSPMNDRFVKFEGMHVVPPPMTGNYMPPKSDFRTDELKFTYGPKQSTTSEYDAKTSDLDSCESCSSEKTLETMPKPVESKPKVVNEPKVWSDTPIIAEYESDSDDEYVSKALVEQEKPSYAFINTVKHDNPHQTLKGKDIVDSGCFRHMIGNKAYLVNYQDFNGGPVAFGCSKDTECLVLSPDIKLLDENQVLLRVPRQHSMYSFNLENIVLLEPITTKNKANKTVGPMETNNSAGTQDGFDAGNSDMEANHAQEYYLLSLLSSYTSTVKSSKIKNGDQKLNGVLVQQQMRSQKIKKIKPFWRSLKGLKDKKKRLMMQLKLLERRLLKILRIFFFKKEVLEPALLTMDGIFTSASYDDEGAVTDFTNLKSTVNILVDLPFGKKAIGTKWVYKIKKDERGVVVRNKARLFAQGHRQEEGIDYDEVFAPMARIEAIMIFLAFASYMGFLVYQMDVKSLQSCKRSVWFTPNSQSMDKKDIMLLQVYVDDIIFGSAKKSWCDEFEVIMKNRFLVTPKTSHLQAVKRIFSYLKGQLKLGDSFYGSAKKQTIVATLTTEAEYVVVASCCGQHHFIRDAYEKKLIQVLKIHTDDNVVDLLTKAFNVSRDSFHGGAKKQTIVATLTTEAEYVAVIYTDNESTICIVKNLVFHSKTKPIEIQHHFIMDAYEKKLIHVLKIHTDDNVVDLLTKAFNVSRMVMLLTLGKKMPFGSVLEALNGDQPPMTKSSSSHNTTQDSRNSLEGTNRSERDKVQSPHDSILFGDHTSDRAEGVLNLKGLFSICTNLSNRVLSLEIIKDAQDANIIALKARLNKLEKMCKPSISHHRTRLKSVQRLSMKKRFGKKESVSKQGRKKDKPEPTLDDSTLDDFDADHGMHTEEPMNQGRLSKETKELVSTARPGDSTVRLDVGTADLIVPPSTTKSIFDDEDITMAQTLFKMKEEKAKKKGDKGKGVLEEPEPAKKMTTSDLDAAQIAKDAEVARLVYEEELAELEREKEKRKREEKASKAEEREEYTIEEGEKFLAGTIVAQRKFRAEQRSVEIRSRPPTKSQSRNLMMTYLKNIDRKRVIDDFKPMDSDDAVDKEKVLEEPEKTKIE